MTVRHVCLVTPEALPWAKSGGLADAAGALARTLGEQGVRVTLMHPAYRGVIEALPRLPRAISSLAVPLAGGVEHVEVLRHKSSCGVTAYLVRHDGFFGREGLYGAGETDYSDNDRRFALFCSAACAALERLKIRPQLFHCHDWQAALVPFYLRRRADLFPFLTGSPSLMTVHNLAFQGLFPTTALDTAGIPPDFFTMHGVEFYGRVSFLKAGLVCADAVSTVSPRYSREIQTPEFGCGLDGLFRERSAVLHGILNGVDCRVWNPGTDPHIAANYSIEDTAAGKERCKAALLAEFGLPAEPELPLMGTVSRLTGQKGVDLIADVLPEIIGMGARYCLLGTGERRLVDLFEDLARRYPGQVAIRIGYNEAMAHRIEAGADFFLMPSRFEPCGLNQMYSLRYGTIPVVRATGGLADTVAPYDPDTGEGNGFTFAKAEPAALAAALRRGLGLFGDPRHRERLRHNAMAADFSLEAMARSYIDLYAALLAGTQGPDQ